MKISKENLQALIEQNKAPTKPLEGEVPNWVQHPDSDDAVEQVAAKNYAFFYHQVLEEIPDHEKAVKSAVGRAKIAAEAKVRGLENFDQVNSVIERSTARTLWIAQETGVWQNDLSEPKNIEEWLAVRLSEEKISPTYRSHYAFLLNGLIPAIRRYATDDAQVQIDKIFCFKANWRRAQAVIPLMRNAIELAQATEQAYTESISAKRVELEEVKTNLLVTDITKEDKKRLESQRDALQKGIAAIEVEKATEMENQNGVLDAVVRASVEIVGGKGSMSTAEVQEKVAQQVSMATGKPLPVVNKTIHTGTILHLKKSVLFVSVLPASLEKTMEVLTRGAIAWRTGEVDTLIENLLRILPDKQAKSLANGILDELNNKK